ncbi:SDR family NAD(P)-dependent oxidoreductase, partial [Chloroflexota bacterium]
AVHMTKQNSGRIINFSSQGAFSPRKSRNLAYGAAKAGVMGFTARLCTELKPYNITVNCILPSAVTDLFSYERTSSGDNMPLAPSYEADMVAPIVVFLATDEAQDITGKYIYSGGGDLCIYPAPFNVASSHAFIRKPGKWTADEIGGVIPSVLGLD